MLSRQHWKKIKDSFDKGFGGSDWFPGWGGGVTGPECVRADESHTSKWEQDELIVGRHPARLEKEYPPFDYQTVVAIFPKGVEGDMESVYNRDWTLNMRKIFPELRSIVDDYLRIEDSIFEEIDVLKEDLIAKELEIEKLKAMVNRASMLEDTTTGSLLHICIQCGEKLPNHHEDCWVRIVTK